MTNVIPVNLNRSRLADELLYQFVQETRADIVLVSEQYRDQEQPTWFSDSLGTAAKWICGQDCSRIVGHGGANGFVWVKRGLDLFQLLPHAQRAHS